MMLKFAVLVLVAAGAAAGTGLDQEAEAGRARRWSVWEALRGKGVSSGTGPTGPSGGGGRVSPSPDPAEAPPPPGEGGFRLEDALRPAVKPSDAPSGGGDCPGILVQKLSLVLQNQNQELRLLQQLLDAPPRRG
ncbi:uncharacterized protein ACNS7B_015163 isoform 1-T3 [Menidia menidia]